jgi:hypothetical protein
MATSDESFFREQEARCRRLAAGCPTKGVADDLLRLADHYAEAATGKRSPPQPPEISPSSG